MVPVSVIISIIASITIVALGAIWKLANAIGTKTSQPEVTQMIAAHDAGGHDNLRNRLMALEVGHGKTEVLIQRIDANVEKLLLGRGRAPTEGDR